MSNDDVTWCFDEHSVSHDEKWEHSERVWEPFDRANSRKIEEAYNQGKKFVLLKCGRFKIDFKERTLKAAYWEAPVRKVVRAQWLVIINQKKAYPHPEYVQDFIQAFLRTKLYNEAVLLPDAEHLIVNHKQLDNPEALDVGQYITHTKKMENLPAKYHGLSGLYQYSSDFSKCYAIRRTHPALLKEMMLEEENKTTNDNTDNNTAEKKKLPYNERKPVHLVLCIHGVGQHAWKKNEEWRFPAKISRVRNQVQEVIEKDYPESDRIEFLPVIWADVVHDTDFKERLTKTSLKTLTTMRDYVHTVAMDVLFYMNTHIHQLIMDYVVNKMNEIVRLFCINNPSFTPSNISIIGHSLGSIIAYDIITNQDLKVSTSSRNNSIDIIDDESIVTPVSWSCPKLTFKAQHLFCLGSPIGMFESFRNSTVRHARGQRCLDDYDFHFYNHMNLWNIFHPYDPVAYRIEPLICPILTEEEPVLIDYSRNKLSEQQNNNNDNDNSSALSRMSSFFGLASSNSSGFVDESEEVKEEERKEKQIQDAIEQMGACNGHRVDFQLQETTLQRAQPMIASLSAHTCYWTSPDVFMFVVEKCQGQVLELETNDDINTNDNDDINTNDNDDDINDNEDIKRRRSSKPTNPFAEFEETEPGLNEIIDDTVIVVNDDKDDNNDNKNDDNNDNDDNNNNHNDNDNDDNKNDNDDNKNDNDDNKNDNNNNDNDDNNNDNDDNNDNDNNNDNDDKDDNNDNKNDNNDNDIGEETNDNSALDHEETNHEEEVQQQQQPTLESKVDTKNKICIKCKISFHNEFNFCDKCGSKLHDKKNIIVCEQCKSTHLKGMRFCDKCGYKLNII